MATVLCRQSDGRVQEWYYGTRASLPVGLVAVEVDDPPRDLTTKRWDGARGLRDATAQERAEALDAQTTDEAQEALDGTKLLKALALAVADLHSLTPAQMRALVVAKYKGL